MSNYIYEKKEQLVRKYHTCDPFELLDHMHVVVSESDRFRNLKGFCFISCRIVYVVINANLPEAEKRVVAAHELGHLVLHRKQLQLAPMQDSCLYDMASRTEYEANLFAADLLLEDSTIEKYAAEEELDYFGLCSLLSVPPELMSFKLFGLLKRGRTFNIPVNLDSRFLAKNEGEQTPAGWRLGVNSNTSGTQ